jgi:hypothetical protein
MRHGSNQRKKRQYDALSEHVKIGRDIASFLVTRIMIPTLLIGGGAALFSVMKNRQYHPQSPAPLVEKQKNTVSVSAAYPQIPAPQRSSPSLTALQH